MRIEIDKKKQINVGNQRGKEIENRKLTRNPKKKEWNKCKKWKEIENKLLQCAILNVRIKINHGEIEVFQQEK